MFKMVCPMFGLVIALAALTKAQSQCPEPPVSQMPRPEVFDNKAFGIDTTEYLSDDTKTHVHVIKDTLCAADTVYGWEYIAERSGTFTAFVGTDAGFGSMNVVQNTEITSTSAGQQYVCMASPADIAVDGSYYGIAYKAAQTDPVVARVIAMTTDDAEEYPCSQVAVPSNTPSIRTSPAALDTEPPIVGGIWANKAFASLIALPGSAYNLGIRPIRNTNFKYTCDCSNNGDSDCNSADTNMICVGGRCECKPGYEYDGKVHRCVKSDIAAGLTAHSVNTETAAVTSTSLTDGNVTTCTTGKNWWVIDLGAAQDVYAVKLTAPQLKESFVTLSDGNGNEENYYGDSTDSGADFTDPVTKIKANGKFAWQIFADTNYQDSKSIFNRELDDKTGIAEVDVSTQGAVTDVKSIRKVVSGRIQVCGATDPCTDTSECLHVSAADSISKAGCGSATIWYLDETSTVEEFYIKVLSQAGYVDDAFEVPSVAADIAVELGASNTAFSINLDNFITDAGVELVSTAWCLVYDTTDNKLEISTTVNGATCYNFKWLPYPEDPHKCHYGESHTMATSQQEITYNEGFTTQPCLEVIDNGVNCVASFFTLNTDPKTSLLDANCYDATFTATDYRIVQWKACVNGLNNFKISVVDSFTPGTKPPTDAGDLCAEYPGYVTWEEQFTFHCNNPLNGQYMVIESRDGGGEISQLCDIQVTSVLECTEDSDCYMNPVDQHKICNKTVFVCECIHGWRWHEDAKLCVDVDQCVDNDLNKCWCADAGTPGVINGTCVNHASSPVTNPNHAGTHECLCPAGYSHDDINGCCRNIDETSQDNCGCEDGCTDKVPDVDGGSLFECNCSTLPGYEVGPDKLSCLDIDECDLNFSNSGKKNCKNSGSVFGDDATIIQGMCNNTAGSYKCSCGAGYEATTESNCKDIDECASNSTNECQHTCVNTNGGYYCACDDSGYEIGVDGESCVDIDECKRGIHICDDGDDSDNGMTHAYCSNTQGSYMCICPDGYLDWNGDICVDINECDLTPTPCEDKCTNKNVDNGGMKYECSCEGYGQGYQLAADGHACQDIDECSEDDPCVANSTNDFESHIDSDEDGKCHNTHGGYTCECSKGYAAENGLNRFDFIKCINIDECNVANGGCDHKCIDGNGNRTCTCDKGYDLLDDEESCKDQDECADEGEGHDCKQVCVNTVGSFTCDCDEGYKLNLDGNTCSNINECTIQNGGCMHTCVDEDPGYNCTCRDGYFLLSNLHECDDHDECVSGEDTCDRNNGYCVNQVARDPHPDGFSCECNQGYKMENDTCVDIDECEVKNGGCHHVCNNDVGTFTCSCRTGYDLADNKEDCDDKNECDAGTDTCDAMHGNCVNTMVSGQHPMGYYCTCNEGYELDGSDNSCDDVDECSTNNGGCTQNCADTDGSFTCSCNHGFTLGPDNRHCDDINECDDSNLCVGGVCVNDIGGYQCICDGEYTYPVEGKRVCFGDEWISIKFCRARPWDDKYDHMSHPDTMELKNEVETAYGNSMRQIPNVDSVTVTSFYEGNGNVCIIMAIKFDTPLQSSQIAVVSSAASDAVDSTSVEIDGEDSAPSQPSEIVYTDPQTNAAASDQVSAPCDYLNNIDYCADNSACVNPDDNSAVPFCLCDEGHTGSDCTPRGLGSDMIALIASLSVIGGLILIGAIIGLAYCCYKSSYNRPYEEYRDDESDKSYYRKDFRPIYYRNPQPAAVYGVYGYRS